MTAEQFAYWLQGYAELNAEPPSAEQWKAIREHLALVFMKVTPQFGIGPISPGAAPNWPYGRPTTTCVARPVGGGDGNTSTLC